MFYNSCGDYVDQNHQTRSILYNFFQPDILNYIYAFLQFVVFNYKIVISRRN